MTFHKSCVLSNRNHDLAATMNRMALMIYITFCVHCIFVLWINKYIQMFCFKPIYSENSVYYPFAVTVSYSIYINTQIIWFFRFYSIRYECRVFYLINNMLIWIRNYFLCSLSTWNWNSQFFIDIKAEFCILHRPIKKIPKIEWFPVKLFLWVYLSMSISVCFDSFKGSFDFFDDISTLFKKMVFYSNFNVTRNGNFESCIKFMDLLNVFANQICASNRVYSTNDSHMPWLTLKTN